MNTLQILVLMIGAYICRFEMWQNTPFAILFTVFFAYGQAVVFSALLVSTIVSRLEQANQISFSLILGVILVNVLFSDVQVGLVCFYNARTMHIGFIRFASFLLEFVPTFSFNLAFGLVAIQASRHFEADSLNWSMGEPFTWEMYNTPKEFRTKATHDLLLAPAAAHFVSRLFQQQILFAVLFWYLDHVLASNRGVAYGALFPFRRQYWMSVCPCFDKRKREQVGPEAESENKSGADQSSSPKRRLKRKAKAVSEKDLGIGVDLQETLDSAEHEEKRVLEDEKRGVHSDGLRIVRIQKIYRKLPFGLKSKNDVHAVRGISLDVAKSELMCLLGHNGAGKSTLFNMLTGIIGPSEGYAKISGHDIRTDQNAIR